MPAMQAMTERANVLFNRENIDKIDPQLLAPGVDLPTAARELGIAATEAEVAFLSTWPAGLQEALRATLYSALTTAPRLPVTLAWAPGYDYEMNLFQAAGTAQSIGGTTVTLRSRYPGDAAPPAAS